MKIQTIIAKSLVAVVLSFGLIFTDAHAGQNDDQIAIHLGAMALGIPDLSAASAQDRVNALAQGRAILKSKQGRAAVGIQGFPISPDVQTDLLRSQILTATQLALTSPQSYQVEGTVILENGRSSRVRATLDPKKTTASAIFSYTQNRLPNFGPDLVGTSITQALSSNGTNFLFNYRTESAALNDVNKIAGLAMKSSLRAYARGTVNWAGVPSAGAGNGTFLPNFSSRPIQPRSSSPQNPDPAGIANAAAAIAASAAAALDAATLTTPKSTAFTGLGTSLVRAAASSQRTSTTTGAGTTPLRGGSVAGAGFGAVIPVTDGAVPDWAAQGNLNLLNAIVAGGIKGSRANAYSFAIGVAQGFAAAYLNDTTPGTKIDAEAFKAANVGVIAQQFFANGVRTGQNFEGVRNKSLVVVISEAIDALYLAHSLNNYSEIAGGAGLQLPGTPTPVTDTVGL
ncbi:MAG: hypothetical protein Fur0032_03520 [Terrimicrobiaceae bacterium]